MITLSPAASWALVIGAAALAALGLRRLVYRLVPKPERPRVELLAMRSAPDAMQMVRVTIPPRDTDSTVIVRRARRELRRIEIPAGETDVLISELQVRAGDTIAFEGTGPVSTFPATWWEE